MSGSMAGPHGSGQAGPGSQDPSHCPRQEQASRDTRAAPSPGTGQLPGDRDGLRLDGTAGSVRNLVELNCNTGNYPKWLNVLTVFCIIILDIMPQI